MKITNDPISTRAAQVGQYEPFFAKLSPENNCIAFDDKKEMERVAQALDKWCKRHIHKSAKVKTTARYDKDGKPRCWLIYPEEAIPAKTAVRGNFPRAA